MFGQRILILVPHPDDEVVGYAAAIMRAKAKGASVFAYYLTHGCIAQNERWFWDKPQHAAHVALRKSEAQQAALSLGLIEAGWCERSARHLWCDLPVVFQEVKDVMSAYSIDQVWVPAYEGGNADHDATNALGSLLHFKPRCETLLWPSVLEFSEYHFAEGRAHSQEFIAPCGTETLLVLTEAERQIKADALAAYASERNNLGYVKTEHEVYRPLAVYDYTKPPHEGTLWYARFQWVPFRHPRVDFTQPAAVCAAIVSLLETASKLAPVHKEADHGNDA